MMMKKKNKHQSTNKHTHTQTRTFVSKRAKKGEKKKLLRKRKKKFLNENDEHNSNQPHFNTATNSLVIKILESLALESIFIFMVVIEVAKSCSVSLYRHFDAQHAFSHEFTLKQSTHTLSLSFFLSLSHLFFLHFFLFNDFGDYK